MTAAEFRFWFEGYAEGIEDSPSLRQWKRICERVKEIDGKPTSYPVFMDRYWHHPYPWNWPSVYGHSSGVGYTGLCGMSNNLQLSNTTMDTSGPVQVDFINLGRADAVSDIT